MEVGSSGAAPLSLSLVVQERSGVGEARRAAAGLAAQLGMSEEAAGRLALILTEAANNVVHHGGGGEVVVRPLADGSGHGAEVLVIDRGPGIADVSSAFRDGYSTAGTPGTGLGALARIADWFDIYSGPGQGTLVVARVWNRGAQGVTPPSLGSAGLELGAVCLPHRGESACGDAWAAATTAQGSLLMVADGLGHGPDAAAAAAASVRLFHEGRSKPPGELLADIHAALRSTRGAAVAIALLDRGRREIRYAGVGNIAGTVVSGLETRSMVSHNGTVGHELRKIQEFVYPWPEHAMVVMHSDGLQTHWRLDRYDGASARHPALVAGLLYRDFNRGRDDVTVVALRESHRGTVRGDLPAGGPRRSHD
jgi:anti-sigma regulatory factor (Ser/Thr protein kinase)